MQNGYLDGVCDDLLGSTPVDCCHSVSLEVRFLCPHSNAYCMHIMEVWRFRRSHGGNMLLFDACLMCWGNKYKCVIVQVTPCLFLSLRFLLWGFTVDEPLHIVWPQQIVEWMPYDFLKSKFCPVGLLECLEPYLTKFEVCIIDNYRHKFWWPLEAREVWVSLRWFCVPCYTVTYINRRKNFSFVSLICAKKLTQTSLYLCTFMFASADLLWGMLWKTQSKPYI